MQTKAIAAGVGAAGMIAALTVGTFVTAPTSAVTMQAVEGPITMARGETLVPRFSVRTDTVLGVAPSKVIAKGCGPSVIYLRLWRGNAMVAADTVNVLVPCSTTTTPPATAGATIQVCLHPDPDSVAKYHAKGDTSIDPKLIPCLDSVPQPVRQLRNTVNLRRAS